MGGGGLEGLEGLAGEAGRTTAALLARLGRARAAGHRDCSRVDGLALVAAAGWCARGTGRHELAIGEGLDVLEERRFLARLGRSTVTDVGREDLGLPGAYARRLWRTARKLRFRPLLRAAVASGAVTPRKAEVLLDNTDSRDDAYWTARAKVDSVRGLLAATRADASEGREDFQSVLVSLPAQRQESVWMALDWARILEGGATSRRRQLEVLLMEYLGTFSLPLEESPSSGRPVVLPPWEGEGQAGTGEVPGAGGASGPVPRHRPEDDWPFDAHASLARLKALVAERASIDEWLRRACLLVQHFKAYQLLGFTSFDAWCTEALGLGPSTVHHLVSLEKQLQRLPPLREAVQGGTLTLEQARHVARNATLADVGRRIAEAASQPALDTQRQAEAEEESRLRAAGKVKLSLSGRVHRLFLDALAAARYHQHGATPGEALQCISAHFLLTWREEVRRVYRQANPAMRRDDWRCQVPGCSQGAEHLHHIVWKSRGGENGQRNLIALCWHHHREGVHKGHIHISGQAPDDVRFELAGKEVMVRGPVRQTGQEAA